MRMISPRLALQRGRSPKEIHTAGRDGRTIRSWAFARGPEDLASRAPALRQAAIQERRPRPRRRYATAPAPDTRRSAPTMNGVISIELPV